MSEIIKKLKRKTSLRTELKTATVNDFERIIKNLNDLLAEKIEREALKAQKIEEKRAAIDKIKSAMQEAGIALDDLKDSETEINKPKQKSKAAPKYAITIDGTRHEWTGRGRTPRVFSEYMLENAIDKNDLPAA